MVPTYSLSLWLVSLQFQPTQTPYMAWGFAIFAIGTFFGVRAYGIRERRVFDTTEVQYTQPQRIKRAAPWRGLGVAMPVIVWWVQVSSDQFSTYWWYAWPALLPLLVGVGLYMLRTEQVLSATGQYARAQLEQAQAKTSEERKARIGAVAGSGTVRYIGAAGCLYVAYWLATDTGPKSTGWAALPTLDPEPSPQQPQCEHFHVASSRAEHAVNAVPISGTGPVPDVQTPQTVVYVDR